MEINSKSTASAFEFPETAVDSKFVSSCSSEQFSVIRIPEDSEKSRKQSKRRKKSSNHSRPLPRIIVKPLPPPPPPENREWTAALSYIESSPTTSKPSTMREVLASIPGFCLKPRKRSGKKLSTAAQLQQTREGCIDLETPDSILVNTNLRQLLNKHTFSLLPPLYQYKLGQLLPSVDRLSPSGRLNSSSLNNEFFARACLEWQESLSGGELTPESQQKMKTEAEKEKSKIDPWKLKHFEPIWGEKLRREKASLGLNTERPSLKTTIKLRPTASITSSSTVPKIKKSKSSSNSKRMRSVGAVTRSSSKTDDIDEQDTSCIGMKPCAPLPDLLPLKHVKHHNNQTYEECQVDCNFSDSSSILRMDDSVTTTPVDPLLLPDGESEEVKQELDISEITIEDNTTKDIDNEKTLKSDTEQDAYKRMSDDNISFCIAKKIKYENEDDGYNDNFVEHSTEATSVTYSEADLNYDCERVCTNDEVYSGLEQGDTHSEDGKPGLSIYEYDERSESSVSSLKMDVNCPVEASPVDEPINTTLDVDTKQSIEEMGTEVSDVNIGNNEYTSYKTELESEIVEEKDIKCTTTEKEDQNFTVKEPENATFKESDVHLNNSIKMDDKDRIPIVTQNYYDERFKDAESLILETGLSSILTPRKFNSRIYR